jgi:hypothetical protein
MVLAAEPQQVPLQVPPQVRRLLWWMALSLPLTAA